jgi:hypothetical protein
LLESGGPNIQKREENELTHDYSMKSPVEPMEGQNSQDVTHVSVRMTCRYIRISPVSEN